MSALTHCAHRPGEIPSRYYTVKAGDTLVSVATANSVDPKDLARVNKKSTTDTGPLTVGEKLFIPHDVASLRGFNEDDLSVPHNSDAAPLSQNKVLKPPVSFVWPLKEPKVTEYFGWRKRKLHEGVDLKASQGTDVLAAGAGTVVYAARRIRSYGKMILIDHGDGWTTAYAHLSEFHVSVGDKVEAGEIIGSSGRTGRVSGPHLHFEIRVGSDPMDPLLWLPRIEAILL